MAERFTRVFELPGGFYAHGSPVLIRAGALLKDNISRNILCQLKFYNLEPVTIRSLTVYLQLQDTAGRNLGKEIRREYLDLRAGKDQSFGQNIALLLPYRNARRFTARVSEVVFADGTLWQDKGSAWHSTAKQPTLREQYGDEEVAAQFRVRYGVDCRYAPTVDGELWYCTCGTVNFMDEHSCHACKRVRRAQLGVSEEALRQECAKRLEKEKREGKKPEKKTEMSVGKAAAVIVPLLLAVALIIFVTPRILSRFVPLPEIDEVQRSSPVETAAPTEAPTPTPPPTPRPTPTPSPEELQRAAYVEAAAQLDAGNYSAARAAFLALEGYSNSEEQASEAVYRKAVALYDFIAQYDEREIYASLSMDPGEMNRFYLSSGNALNLGSDVIAVLRSACGGDAVDIAMTDTPPEGIKPLSAGVKDLFSYLGDYRDSADRLSKLEVMTDYTRDFYMLLEAGDIYSAYDWLEVYQGDFPGRDHWLQLLNLYKPFCDDWVLFAGDPTLIPLTTGHAFECMRFNSRVIINGDQATLRFRIPVGETEVVLDLYAETGNLNFGYDTNYFYLAAVSHIDHMAYMKYLEGSIVGSVEYERAG